MRLAVLPRTLPRDPMEVVLRGLHESHDVAAYEAVERLLYTAEDAGVDTQALLRMLDQGIAFQNVLDLIISKAKSSQKAA
jgi:hypothetical protein